MEIMFKLFTRKPKNIMDKPTTLRDLKLVYDLLIVVAKKCDINPVELADILINDSTKADFINELTLEISKAERAKYGDPEKK